MKFVDPTGMENERVFMGNPVYVVPISTPVPASKYRSLSENEIAGIVGETPQMWKNVVEAYAHEYLVHVPSRLVDPYKDDNGPLYWDVRAVESLERIQPVIEELTGVTVSLISGFRTFAEQSELKKVNPQAEDPGKSYHNLPIKISEGTPQEVMTKIFSGEGIIGADFRYKNGGSLTDVFWALETFGGFEGITEPLPIGTKNPEFRHKNLPLNNLKPGMSLDFVESRQNPLDDMPVP
jgi:hypothetical protein